MTQADTLFLNAHILTMDETMTQYPRGAVAVTGDSIVAVGPEDAIKKEYTGTETIDCKGRVLMPGLVNAHTHVPMTLLRGMLRAEVLSGHPPDRILHDLNQLAQEDLAQSHRFVTLFYSDFDPRTRLLRSSCRSPASSARSTWNWRRSPRNSA